MKSLLSILSHVVHGYVGNRATVFPCSMLGGMSMPSTLPIFLIILIWIIEWDCITTRGHTRYNFGTKQILDFNNVYDIILTGYTPNAEVLQILKSEIEQAITNSRNKPHWIVDPVLGDNGKLYVKENLIPVYRDIFASGLVELTTPNQLNLKH